MFTSVFFVVLTLLTINLAADGATIVYPLAPSMGLLLGLTFYASMLIGMFFQHRWLLPRHAGSRWPTLLVNVELILFLLVYHFVLGAHRPYHNTVLGGTALALPTLFLYFSGLGWHHYLRGQWRYGNPSAQRGYAYQQVRFLLPFCLPFLAFGILQDLVLLIPLPTMLQSAGWSMAVYAVGLLLFLVTMLLFLPPLVVKTWGCTPLIEQNLNDAILALCYRNQFRHGGLLVWSVMDGMPTAAIVGILPRFRYILFTPTLLRSMTTDEIEAIVAHEMGHSYRRHLLIYPLIIMGMVVVSGLFFYLVGPSIQDYIQLQQIIYPSQWWEPLRAVGTFIPYALILALYFRIVFGYFSRNFERQADLHCFHAGVPAEHMISALNHIGVITGGTHDHPSWHHYSIRQRIDFLQAARQSPGLIPQHHRRVRRRLAIYFLLLGIGGAMMVSPMCAHLPLFRDIAYGLDSTSRDINLWANRPRINKIAASYREQYGLDASPAIMKELEESLLDYGALSIPGLLEFYAAQRYNQEGLLKEAAIMMEGAWRHFDFSIASAQARQDFLFITQQIIDNLDEAPELHDDLLRLRTAAQQYDPQQRPLRKSP